MKQTFACVAFVLFGITCAHDITVASVSLSEYKVQEKTNVMISFTVPNGGDDFNQLPADGVLVVQFPSAFKHKCSATCLDLCPGTTFVGGVGGTDCTHACYTDAEVLVPAGGVLDPDSNGANLVIECEEPNVNHNWMRLRRVGATNHIAQGDTVTFTITNVELPTFAGPVEPFRVFVFESESTCCADPENQSLDKTPVEGGPFAEAANTLVVRPDDMSHSSFSDVTHRFSVEFEGDYHSNAGQKGVDVVVSIPNLRQPVKEGGKFEVTFPGGFDLSEMSEGISRNNQGGLVYLEFSVDGVWSSCGAPGEDACEAFAAIEVHGNSITLTRPAGVNTIEAGQAVTFRIVQEKNGVPHQYGMRNPEVSGETGIFTVSTRDAAGRETARGSTHNGVAINHGKMPLARLDFETLANGQIGSVEVECTLVNPLPQNGKVVVGFPPEFPHNLGCTSPNCVEEWGGTRSVAGVATGDLDFVVGSDASYTAGTNLLQAADYAIRVETKGTGPEVHILLCQNANPSACTTSEVIPGGSVLKFKIKKVTNPASAGDTGTFSISSKNYAHQTIDEKAQIEEEHTRAASLNIAYEDRDNVEDGGFGYSLNPTVGITVVGLGTIPYQKVNVNICTGVDGAASLSNDANHGLTLGCAYGDVPVNGFSVDKPWDDAAAWNNVKIPHPAPDDTYRKFSALTAGEYARYEVNFETVQDLPYDAWIQLEFPDSFTYGEVGGGIVRTMPEYLVQEADDRCAAGCPVSLEPSNAGKRTVKTSFFGTKWDPLNNIWPTVGQSQEAGFGFKATNPDECADPAVDDCDPGLKQTFEGLRLGDANVARTSTSEDDLNVDKAGQSITSTGVYGNRFVAPADVDAPFLAGMLGLGQPSPAPGSAMRTFEFNRNNPCVASDSEDTTCSGATLPVCSQVTMIENPAWRAVAENQCLENASNNDGAIPAGTRLNFAVVVKNPTQSGHTGNFRLVTRNADNEIIDDTGAHVPGPYIYPGHIDVGVTFRNTKAAATGNVLVSFTQVNPLPAGGKIVVKFPPQFESLLTVIVGSSALDNVALTHGSRNQQDIWEMANEVDVVGSDGEASSTVSPFVTQGGHTEGVHNDAKSAEHLQTFGGYEVKVSGLEVTITRNSMVDGSGPSILEAGPYRHDGTKAVAWTGAGWTGYKTEKISFELQSVRNPAYAIQPGTFVVKTLSSSNLIIDQGVADVGHLRGRLQWNADNDAALTHWEASCTAEQAFLGCGGLSGWGANVMQASIVGPYCDGTQETPCPPTDVFTSGVDAGYLFVFGGIDAYSGPEASDVEFLGPSEIVDVSLGMSTDELGQLGQLQVKISYPKPIAETYYKPVNAAYGPEGARGQDNLHVGDPLHEYKACEHWSTWDAECSNQAIVLVGVPAQYPSVQTVQALQCASSAAAPDLAEACVIADAERELKTIYSDQPGGASATTTCAHKECYQPIKGSTLNGGYVPQLILDSLPASFKSTQIATCGDFDSAVCEWPDVGVEVDLAAMGLTSADIASPPPFLYCKDIVAPPENMVGILNAGSAPPPPAILGYTRPCLAYSDIPANESADSQIKQLFQFTIDALRNPMQSGATSMFEVAVVEQGVVAHAAVELAAVEISPGQMQGTGIADPCTSETACGRDSCAAANTQQYFKIGFETKNSIPTDGKIKVIFPPEFHVPSEFNGLSNMDNEVVAVSGNLQVSGDGDEAVTFEISKQANIATLTRNGHGQVISAFSSVSFTLKQVTTPNAGGVTGTFKIQTTSAFDNIIDEQEVAGITVCGGVGGGAGPGSQGTTAGTSGDPHFYGFEGDRYDVNGVPGKWYNILSDVDVQYNAYFTTQKHLPGTVIGAALVKVGKDSIFYDREGAAFIVQGGRQGPVEPGAKINLAGGTVEHKSSPPKLIVKTPHYVIRLAIKEEGSEKLYINQKVTMTKVGVSRVLKRGFTPHGLLGQTADMDGKPRIGKVGADAQGQGAIDGTYKDYEVANWNSDKFKFNRFGIDKKQQKTLSSRAEWLSSFSDDRVKNLSTKQLSQLLELEGYSW